VSRRRWMATAVLLAVLLPTAGALSAQSRQGLLSLPRRRFVPLDSGHFPYIEDPQGLAEAVSGFLAGLGGG